MKIDTRPKYIFVTILVLILVGYSLYQARFIIIGPELRITSHKDGHSVTDSLIILEGVARNVAWLSLNDRQIFTDENGFWSEKLIVGEGLSIITVRASDRFGREITKHIQLVRPIDTHLN